MYVAVRELLNRKSNYTDFVTNHGVGPTTRFCAQILCLRCPLTEQWSYRGIPIPIAAQKNRASGGGMSDANPKKP